MYWGNISSPTVLVVPKGKNIGKDWLAKASLPLSAYDLHFDEYSQFLRRIYHTHAFQRQKGIAQLQQLIPSTINKNLLEQKNCKFSLPFFPHTQFDHVFPMGPMALYVLRRNGFSDDIQKVFAATCCLHDFASPALRDVGMRLNKNALSEEKNFAKMIRHYQFDKELGKYCTFNADLCQRWVEGDGDFGFLLDVLDKVTYVALDASHLLKADGSQLIHRWTQKYPFAVDIWLDLCYEDEQWYFSNPERLYAFLVLRGLLHTELYWNPPCRILEHLVFWEASKLYRRGWITDEQLLKYNDEWLLQLLFEKSGILKSKMSTHMLSWKGFDSQAESNEFCNKNAHRVFYTEQIKDFKTGLDWLVQSNGKLKCLHETISNQKREYLEKLSRQRNGWYAYFFRN